MGVDVGMGHLNGRNGRHHPAQGLRVSQEREGVPTGVHTILRVSNVGGREVRFEKSGAVLIWDGSLMRFRPPNEKERSAILVWISDLKKMAESLQA